MIDEKKITLFEIIGIIVFVLVMLSALFFCIYYAVSYLELRYVIKQCNTDFGIGNWTFSEDTESYSCHAYSQSSFITSSVTTSRDCTINGIKVNCSEIDK